MSDNALLFPLHRIIESVIFTILILIGHPVDAMNLKSAVPKYGKVLLSSVARLK